MQAHWHRRSGVTLLELVIVLGVITLLVAISLPAVQAARESARQLQCRNHLHQIGIATHNFHSAHGRLPFSIHPLTELLPDMGERAVYEALQTPDASIPTSPIVYRCPSDPLAIGTERRISYHLNGGSAIDPPNGVFEDRNSPTLTLRDLIDGQSTTALFSERLTRKELPAYPPVEIGRKDPLRFLWQTGVEFLPGRERELASWCLDGQNLAQASYGVMYWGTGMLPSENGWYNHILPPGHWSFMNGDFGYHTGPYPATSLHSGGVNVLMADGAVRFVTPSIDLDTWWALGSRAGGDVAGEF